MLHAAEVVVLPDYLMFVVLELLVLPLANPVRLAGESPAGVPEPLVVVVRLVERAPVASNLLQHLTIPVRLAGEPNVAVRAPSTKHLIDPVVQAVVQQPR